MNLPLLQRFSRQLFERRWITGVIALLLLLVSLLLGWQWEQRENANQVRQVTVQARILAGSVAGAPQFPPERCEKLSALSLFFAKNTLGSPSFSITTVGVMLFFEPAPVMPLDADHAVPSWCTVYTPSFCPA